jgi:tetratricopeptide (TPR) repeat protein
MEKGAIMTAETSETHWQDPAYRQTLQQLQRGEWQPGMDALKELGDRYPLSQELRSLRAEMTLRARIDADELADIVAARQRRLKNWGIRAAAVLAIVALVLVAYSTYATWLQQQVQSARANIEQELHAVQLAADLRNAQDLLQAGRAGEARQVLQGIAAKVPDYPGLDQTMQQADALAALEDQYNQAMQQVQAGDPAGALATLEQISTNEPYYRDVSIQITDLKRQIFLSDMVTQADQAFSAKDWAKAVSGYETIRALDPLYQTQAIEDHLYQSYINAAEAALAEPSATLEALQAAEDYYSKALALRPQNQEIQELRAQARATVEQRLVNSYINAARAAIAQNADSLQALAEADAYLSKAQALRPDDESIKQERKMAQLFMKSQDDYSKGLWSDVIADLEFVIGEDTEYAGGTARFTLFEAYLARGDNSMASAQYDSALSDYQRAAVLAQQVATQAPLQLYEAQIKVGDVQGVLGDYESAVTTYQQAIELIDLPTLLQKNEPGIYAKLQQAERYVSYNNFRYAYRTYKDITSRALPRTAVVTHSIQTGEYLTQLAKRYNTTVEAILLANQDLNLKKFNPGQELVIPVLP